jgi:hypothetical protein
LFAFFVKGEIAIVQARLTAFETQLSTIDLSSPLFLPMVNRGTEMQKYLNQLLTLKYATTATTVAATVNPLQQQMASSLASGNYLAAGNVLVSALDNRVKAPADRGTYSSDELLLFSKNLLGPDTIDRESALEQVRNYLESPFDDHGAILVTWAAPGSGKTHLLAHVARCIASGGWKGPNGGRLVPLLVTFNDRSQLGVLGVRGVIVRILATFFCGVVALHWADLASVIDGVLPADFTVERALSIVRVHAGVDATLVVLLDEVSKCLDIEMVDPKTPAEVVAIRRAFYSPLTSTKLVMTTLNFVIAQDAPRFSGPRLDWVDLPPLRYEALIAAPAIASVMIGEREKFKPFIALLAGHARSLARLVAVLSTRAGLLTHEKMNYLCEAAADGYAIPTRAIATLLLGFSVQRDGSVLSATIESGIANGGLFGFSNDDGMKPVASLYALRGQLATEDDDVWTLSRRAVVLQLLDIIFHNAGDRGLGFETMHAHAMAVRSVARLVARLEGVKHLEDMPLFKTVATMGVTGAMLLYGRDVVVRDTARDRVVQLSHTLSSPQVVPVVGPWSIAETAPVVTVDMIDSSTVYLPGERNPGFDIIELYEVADPGDPAAAAGKHLVLTETKYSDADATTTFCIDDARGKMANVNTFLERTLVDASSPIVRAGITSADQVTLLFALHRDHTSVVSAQTKAVALAAGYRFNIAVVTKPQLRELYGPTLAPLFDFQAGTFASSCLP